MLVAASAESLASYSHFARMSVISVRSGLLEHLRSTTYCTRKLPVSAAQSVISTPFSSTQGTLVQLIAVGTPSALTAVSLTARYWLLTAVLPAPPATRFAITVSASVMARSE